MIQNIVFFLRLDWYGAQSEHPRAELVMSCITDGAFFGGGIVTGQGGKFKALALSGPFALGNDRPAVW